MIGELSRYLDTQNDLSDSEGKLDKLYEKLESLGYALEELKPVLEEGNTTLILSGAGAGKTTALILKINADFLSGKLTKKKTVNGIEIEEQSRVWVSTFLKTGAEELEREFRKWNKILGINNFDFDKIKFSTIHSEVYSALKDMEIDLKVETDISKYIKKAMEVLEIKPIVNLNTSGGVSQEQIRDMQGLSSYVRNVLDENKYNHPLMKEYSLTEEKMAKLIQLVRQYKQSDGVMDFEDMQEILLQGVRENEKVKEFIANRYDYLYVDEFQDVSQLQYELLKTYFSGASRVLCIGDDDQCIYGWRGSDVSIITTKFVEDYNPEVKTLTVNYRCASNILEAVKPSIITNKNRIVKPLRAFNKGGELFINYNGGVLDLFDDVKEDLDKGYTVGIISRTNADLIIPTLILDLNTEVDLNYQISNMISLQNGVVKQIIDVMGLVLDTLTPRTEHTLKSFVARNEYYQVEKIISFLRANPGETLETLDIEDIEYSTPALLPVVEILRSEDTEKEKYYKLLKYMSENVYKTDSLYAIRARDFIHYLKIILEEHPVVKNIELRKIYKLFTDTIPKRMDLRRDAHTKTKNQVKLTTVHDAKGKEWDSVYIWNSVEGTFPNSLGNRTLKDEEMEEERRVNYIAWTRAKKKLCVYTRTDLPAGFLGECDISNAEIITHKMR